MNGSVRRLGNRKPRKAMTNNIEFELVFNENAPRYDKLTACHTQLWETSWLG